MTSNNFAVFLLVGLFGVYDVQGIALTASVNSACTSSSSNIPTGSGVSVTLTCSGTSSPTLTIAGTAGSSTAAALIFKQGGTAKFTLTGAASGDGTAIASDDTTNYPDADLSSSIPASNANALQVVIANAAAATASGGTWTCEVTADDGATVTGDSASTALDLAAFCSGTLNTITLTATHTATNCEGTIKCDIGATVTTVQGTGGIIQFLKGTTVMYQLLADGTKANSGGSAITDPVITTSGQEVIATYSSTTELDGNQDGSWTCQVISSTSGTNTAVSSAVAVQITDQTQCATKYNLFKYDHCNKQLICELTADVSGVQSNSGVVTFTKGTTATYVVGTDDSLTTGTGATVAAPGTNSKQVVLTLTTYDAATIDGDWKCGVTGSSTTAENGDSAVFTLAYSCSNNKGSQLTLNVLLVLVAVFAAVLY